MDVSLEGIVYVSLTEAIVSRSITKVAKGVDVRSIVAGSIAAPTVVFVAMRVFFHTNFLSNCIKVCRVSSRHVFCIRTTEANVHKRKGVTPTNQENCTIGVLLDVCNVNSITVVRH